MGRAALITQTREHDMDRYKVELMLTRIDNLRISMKIVTDQIGTVTEPVPASVTNWAMGQLRAGQRDAERMMEDIRKEAIEDDHLIHLRA